jgi:RNA-directed DNA polymerase
MKSHNGTSDSASPAAQGWHQLDWSKIYPAVRKTQLQIAQATRENDWRRVGRLQRLLTRSFYGRCWAVKRVTENRGRKTPGVDGEIWGTPQAKWNAISQLSKIRGYRPKPLRRVWIPKPGKTEKRPLGIPTMLDRAMQALYLLALEPAVEMTSDPKSYGFRSDRSTADAMVELFHLLSPKTGPQRVMDADIKAFFDRISHDWLIKSIPMDKEMLRKWLKAGVIDQCTLMATEDGTPQGGIISPCLANATLNGLETGLKVHLCEQFGKTKGSKLKVSVVRYADDFVVLASSKELGEVKHRQLYQLASTDLVRHKRLPEAYSPFDPEHELKWEKLRAERMRHTLRYSKEILKLLIRQEGKCALCGHEISKETGWHDHHIVRRVDGGPDTLKNRAVLHPNCHAQLHSRGMTQPLKYSGIRNSR